MNILFPPPRALAILRAIAADRAEMTCGSEPDLFFDGLACCDQSCAHLLSRHGFVEPSRPGAAGQRVPARITATGTAALATFTGGNAR
ncbi:hypothetical protein ABZ639_25560 [Saccharomonospora sp. NPDC006951]